MVERNCVVSYLIVGDCAVVVPASAAVFHLFKHIQTFAVIPVLNIVHRRAQILLVFGFCLRALPLPLTCPALTAEAPEVSETAEAKTTKTETAKRVSLTAKALATLTLTLCAVAVTLLRLIFALSLIHNHAVCLLNLFELFLKLLLVRLSDIRIRMVFAAQCPVCFFNFILGGIIGDAQHFVWIHGLFFLAFLFNLLRFGFAVAHPNAGV